MDVRIGNSCSSATASNHATPPSDPPYKMSALKKIQLFFRPTDEPDALACIRRICHPPIGTTRADVVGCFKCLRTLAWPGYRENFQLGRHAEDHFCILDINNQEILAATFNDAGGYTVQYLGYSETHPLTPATPVNTPPQTIADYKATWLVWINEAPPEEYFIRCAAAKRMYNCLKDKHIALELQGLALTTLPDHLPPDITELKIKRTHLSHLPLQLPAKLVIRDVSENPLLTSLPPLPTGLLEQRAHNNQRTDLPENFAALPPGAEVYLESKPLSEHARQTLREMSHSHPRIRFSMAGPYSPRQTRPLHQAVADWLAPASEGDAPADRWQAFGQEDDAAAFSTFLDRLSKTKNYKKDPGFKTQTASWLTQLAEDDALRAKTFAIATEATSSCEDRVTLALNQMKNVQLEHHADKGEYDKALLELVSVGRQMFCLEKLEQIAREKVRELNLKDEIEVYLGYQNKLREPLGLTSVTAEMFFFDVSGITTPDLQTAEKQVKTAEDSEFRTWILQWGPLRSVLARTYPETWAELCEKRISDYNDAYRRLCGKEKNQVGLDDDSDADHIIGVRALESAEQAFLEGLRPLADRILDGYLKALWP